MQDLSVSSKTVVEEEFFRQDFQGLFLPNDLKMKRSKFLIFIDYNCFDLETNSLIY